MKTKMCIVGILLTTVVCISGCVEDQLMDKVDILSSPEVEGTVADDLEVMFKLQSDPELILSDRIIFKNSMFILDISPKEARELMIPDDLYQKYVKQVEDINKSPNN